jgi:hypothetical protein
MSMKKPAAIKRLEGNPGQYPIEEIGIEALGTPFIPEHLADDARGCIEVIQKSMPPRIYSALDTFLLSAFGMAWALHKQAALEISARDFKAVYAVNETGALAQSPWIAILNKQALILASLGDRLGL